MWVRGLALGVFAGAHISLIYGADADIPGLRAQLAAAEAAEDKPAIIELSRRIVQAAPQDTGIWSTLIKTQLAAGDYDRCAAMLNAWETTVKPRPAVIDDLRGDLAKARKNDGTAERCWRAYLARRPKALETLQKLAALCADQGRWPEAIQLRTRALTVEENATDRLGRARAYLSLRNWDKAFADMDRANALDPSDPGVKESLPQFELLKTLLPPIRNLDARIAASARDPVLWLDRACLFTRANRPELALDDCQEAIKRGPLLMRARVQTGEALLDLGRGEEAAKLGVSYRLARDDKNHVSEKALRTLGDCDLEVVQEPGRPEPLVARAKALRALNQYLLALTDAQAAAALDPNSADAHFQAAHALDGLGRPGEAMVQVVKATELAGNDPVVLYYRGLLEAQRADFEAAIESQTRSLAIRESYVALQQRERIERRIGRVREADADAARLQQLPPPE
jgi:tetratricopeptide (TPR) repeat protein